jgi:hypothetical protein
MYDRKTSRTTDNQAIYDGGKNGLAEVGSVVQCSAVQCSVVQCSALQCSVVQCSAVVNFICLFVRICEFSMHGLMYTLPTTRTTLPFTHFTTHSSAS